MLVGGQYVHRKTTIYLIPVQVTMEPRWADIQASSHRRQKSGLSRQGTWTDASVSKQHRQSSWLGV